MPLPLILIVVGLVCIVLGVATTIGTWLLYLGIILAVVGAVLLLMNRSKTRR